jgi:hypothetical protein
MPANAVIRYFDLQSERRHRGLVANAANGEAGGGGGAGGGSGSGGGGPSYPVWPQYLALVVGIFVQPYLSYYVQHGSWSLDPSGVVGRVRFGLIVGALAFPALYKNAFDPAKPLFVQLCTIFAGGIGWQSVIQGGAKAALGITS